MKLYLYSIILLGLNVLDWLMTWYVVGHNAVEIMPVARYIIQHHGIMSLLAFKIISVVLLSSVCIYLKLIDMLKMLCLAMILVCVLMVGSMAMNVYLGI